jgi:Kef-type K+ transport system membrane component KefB
MVVGEMVAGLMLGPAVFGAAAPGLQAALFQRSSLPELDAISQLGLVLLRPRTRFQALDPAIYC